MYSYSGPRMATGDINGDGLDDIFICGARGQAGTLFAQQKNGSFKAVTQNPFLIAKESQDEHATFFDADGDTDLDLYVVSGGYLFDYNDSKLQDRLYINDGKGNFTVAQNSIPEEREAGSFVT